MAFIDVPTLNGGHVHVGTDSVYRITRDVRDAAGATLTRVEFGDDYQLTSTSAADVARLMTDAGASLVRLTGIDGTEIFLNVVAITAVRAADPHLDASGANAVVTVASHRQAVRQTQAQVQQALAAAG